MELFKLLGTIAIDNAEAKKALQETGQEGEQTESKLSKAFSALGKGAAIAGKAIATGLAVGATAMAGLTVKALQASGDLEQNMGGAEAVFGELGKTIGDMATPMQIFNAETGKVETQMSSLEQVSKQAFQNMGLSQSDYLATANKMGALFKGAGFETQEALDLSSQAMQRAADVASIMGLDTSAAMEAVAGAAKGNFTMMDNLGVAMNDTAIGAYALEKGISKSTSEMSQQEKIGLAMEMFLEKTAYAAGNYSKENATLAGSLGTAKSALTNFLSGSGDVESLVSSFSNLASVIVQNITEIAPRLTQGISDLVAQIAPMIAPLLQTLLPVLIEGAITLVNGLVAALPSIIQALLNALPMLIDGVVQALNAIVDALPDIIQAIVDALPTIIPALINGVTTVIVKLCESFGDIIQPLIDALPEILITIVEAIVNNLPAIIQGLITLVMSIVEAIPQIIQAIVDALPTIISLIITSLLENLPLIIEGLIQVVMGIVKSLPQIFMSLIEGIANIFVGIWDGIKNVFSNGKVGGYLKDVFSGAWEKVKSVVSSALEGIKNIASNIWNGIKNAISSVMDGIKNVISNIWNGIKSIVSSVLNGIKNVVSNIWNGIKSAISKALNAIKSVVSSVWNGIKSAISSVLNGIKNVVSNIWNGIKSAISNVLSGIKNAVSNAWNNIKSAISKVLTSIVDTVKKGASKMLEAGKDLVRGIWEGISNAYDWIKEKITGWVGSVTKFIKKLFGIKSPSTVMRDQVGKEIARGVAVGIEAEISSVEDSMAKLSERTCSAVARIYSDSQIDETIANMTDRTTDAFEDHIDLMQTYYKITLADEVAFWDKARTAFQEGTEERFKSDKKYFEAKEKLEKEQLDFEKDLQNEREKLAEQRKAVDSNRVKTAQEQLDRYKVYSEVTLADEVAFWDMVRLDCQEGTEERIEADKKFFEAKKTMNEKLVESEKKLQTSLNAIYEKTEERKKEILDSFDLFSEYTEGNSKPVSYREMNQALDSQIKTMELYDEEMKELEKRIGGTALYEELEKMGFEGLSQIQEFNKLDDWQLDSYLKKYEKRQQLASKMAKEELASENIQATNEAYQEFANSLGTIGIEVEGVTGEMQQLISNSFAGITFDIETTTEKTAICMQTFASAITGALTSIKEAFGDWEGNFKLPHFYVNGSLDIETGSVPEIDVAWYKKAMTNATILDKPTIFGYSAKSGSLLGGGEAGSEIVAGSQTLMNMIQTAVSEQNTTIAIWLQKVFDILSEYFPQMLDAFEAPIEFNTNSMASALAVPMNRELGKISSRKDRGR